MSTQLHNFLNVLDVTNTPSLGLTGYHRAPVKQPRQNFTCTVISQQD